MYTHLTFLRHLGMFAALFSLPFWFMALRPALFWLYHHAWFFAGWTAAAVLTGLAADRLVRRGSIAGFFQRSDATADALPYFQRLLVLWAGCSRCVAYWCGGAAAVLITLMYWPLDVAWWAGLMRAVYFGLSGASLAAATAIVVYLTGNRK